VVDDGKGVVSGICRTHNVLVPVDGGLTNGCNRCALISHLPREMLPKRSYVYPADIIYASGDLLHGTPRRRLAAAHERAEDLG
jgi:hypothetical protein